jgi:hypothetical protein
MIERERFEVWARQRWAHPEDFDQRIKAPSKYNNYEVQAAWEAWQERAAQPAPSVPIELLTDYLVSISAHVAHQEEPQAQAEIGELLRMLAATQEAKP